MSETQKITSVNECVDIIKEIIGEMEEINKSTKDISVEIDERNNQMDLTFLDKMCDKIMTVSEAIDTVILEGNQIKEEIEENSTSEDIIQEQVLPENDRKAG